jgi:hypothetical protein
MDGFLSKPIDRAKLELCLYQALSPNPAGAPDAESGAEVKAQ